MLSHGSQDMNRQPGGLREINGDELNALDSIRFETPEQRAEIARKGAEAANKRGRPRKPKRQKTRRQTPGPVAKGSKR
jgi:hypothetical protein